MTRADTQPKSALSLFLICRKNLFRSSHVSLPTIDISSIINTLRCAYFICKVCSYFPLNSDFGIAFSPCRGSLKAECTVVPSTLHAAFPVEAVIAIDGCSSEF